MSTTTQAWDAEKIGRAGDPIEFAVERDRIAAYAAATNDDIPQHASGDLAPPVFSIVPAFGALGAATASVIPPELLLSILHGEQDVVFHRPMEPGMTLVTRATPIGFHPRSSGVTVVARSETTTPDGTLVNEQYMTAFVRGATCPAGVGETAPGHAFDASLRDRAPDGEISQRFDADQTYRYSAASGDMMPVHLDDDVARSVGLPGIIIHGLCTMAFTARAAITHACPDDPSRLRRLAVRFSKVVRPEQTITTRIWAAGESSGRAAFAYETTSDEDAVVIKDGLAEIAG